MPVPNYVRTLPHQTLPEDVTAQLCAEFQDVAFQHVEDRLRRALQYMQREGIEANALVVVGGVAANLSLRRCIVNINTIITTISTSLLMPSLFHLLSYCVRDAIVYLVLLLLCM